MESTSSSHHRSIIQKDDVEFQQIESIYKNNHIGILKLPNNREIKTPVIWYGLSVVESVDFQLEVFEKTKVTAFLSNVYDLIVQDKKKKREKLIEILTEKGLAHKMDSGGFQLMKYRIQGKKIPVEFNQELVFNKQLEVGCDVAVQLDVPLSPFLNKKEQKAAVDQTIKNFKELLELNQKQENPLSIMPVVHGYTEKMIDYCVSKYESILGEIPIIGIGSLVPMVKSIKGTDKIGGKWTFVKNLIYLRKRLPNTMIHAFGIGGTMSYLAFYCGIDSLDSNGWIQKAAYGVIQLPGVSDRFLRKKEHGRPYLIEKRTYRGKKTIYEKKLFMKCKCPVCRPFSQYSDQESAWNEKVDLFDQDGKDGRLIRSIHNVYLFNNELKLIRRAIIKGQLDRFIEERLTTSTYFKLFLYAKYLKKDDVERAESIKLNRNVLQNKLDIFVK